MYGSTPNCLFAVFGAPAESDQEELDRWYDEVHGPDALLNGTFTAVHRYRAVGPYDASNLALWEGSFRTVQEARDYIVPRATRLNSQGRVTSIQNVVWNAMTFLVSAQPNSSIGDVRSLTLVERSVASPESDDVDGEFSVYRYGSMTLYESARTPEEARALFAGLGTEGMAPYGPYARVTTDPDGWLLEKPEFDGVWVSHWAPAGSQRVEDLK